MISKIRIIAVGKIKERYILEGINEYLKRLKPFYKIEILELKDQGLKKEADKIAPYLDAKSFILDSSGTQLSSEEFAALLKKEEGLLTFAIGGPEGIEQNLKSKHRKISLSRMTFLHEMTRLILIEQIYRAYTIINNRAYHK